MKRRKLNKSLVASICSSVCLLGASAGIVFGISAGAFKIRYLPLENDVNARLSSARVQNYYNQKITSGWNMHAGFIPTERDIKVSDDPKTPTAGKWDYLHGSIPLPNKTKDGTAVIDFGNGDINETQAKNRWNYAAMVIDGSTHSTLDRSFNQSLYNGIVNFIQNKDIPTTKLTGESTVIPSTVLGNFTAASFKPAEDNNNGLANTYKAVAANPNKFRALGLAGFNHCSPLGIIGKNEEFEDGTLGKFILNNEYQDLAYLNMLLIDGNIANNQYVSSVIFRSDQPGFLTGISTCMYFYNNLQTYHKGFRNLSVGAYGGNPIPTVSIYMGGVQRGLEFFNKFVLLEGILNTDAKAVRGGAALSDYKDLANLINYSQNKDELTKWVNNQESKYTTFEAGVEALYNEYKVNMIKLGGYQTHFTGSFASGDAIGITKQFLNRGASAIIAVAGPQSLDSAQEIQNQKSDCIVIGVDTAMEEGQYQRVFGKTGFEDVETDADGKKAQQANNIIKFSAVKDMATVTNKFLNLCKENKNYDVEADIPDPRPAAKKGDTIKGADPAKAICGVGYRTCGNIQNGLISISFDGWHPFVKAMRHVKFGDNSFVDAWTQAAKDYLKTTELSEELKTALSDINNIDTYNKDKVLTGEETVYKNYSTIMAILGTLLSSESNKINFDGMSVTPTLDASMNVIDVKATPKEEANMTILDWLANNMYFTC